MHFDPNDTVVTVGDSHCVSVWNWRNGQRLGRFEAHNTRSWDVCRINDHMIVTSSNDTTLRLWDLADQRPEESKSAYIGHREAVNNVDASEEEQLLASTSNDQTVRLWNVHRSRPISCLEGHISGTYGVCFLGDLHLVATGSRGRMVLHDIRTRETVKTWSSLGNTVGEIAFNPQQKCIISACHDGKTRIHHLDETPDVAISERRPVTAICLTGANHEQLIVGCAAGEIWGYDLEKIRTLPEMRGAGDDPVMFGMKIQSGTIHRVRRLPAGLLASASHDSSVVIVGMNFREKKLDGLGAFRDKGSVFGLVFMGQVSGGGGGGGNVMGQQRSSIPHPLLMRDPDKTLPPTADQRRQQLLLIPGPMRDPDKTLPPPPETGRQQVLILPAGPLQDPDKTHSLPADAERRQQVVVIRAPRSSDDDASSSSSAPSSSDRHILDPNHVEITGPLLGKGGFCDWVKKGRLYLGQIPMDVAVKKLSLNVSWEDIQSEVRTTAGLKHQHIVTQYGCYRDGEGSYIVTEFCDGGSLPKYRTKHRDARQGGRFKPGRALLEIARGMAFLHENSVIHRDLKPENILIHQGVCKVCDFGISKPADRCRGTLCGTLAYMPADTKGDPQKIDVYSFGIMAWQICTNQEPFKDLVEDPDMTAFEFLKQIHQFGRRPSTSGHGIPSGIKALIKICWSPDKDERPTFAEIVSELEEIKAKRPARGAGKGGGRSRRRHHEDSPPSKSEREARRKRRHSGGRRHRRRVPAIRKRQRSGLFGGLFSSVAERGD